MPEIEEVFSSKTKTKILKLLALNGEMSLQQLITKTGNNHFYVSRYLDYFLKIGLIHKKQFGRMKIYQLNMDSLQTRVIYAAIKSWEGLRHAKV